MSEERLEEIRKNNYIYQKELESDVLEDISWLIEQAERVQDLEEFVSNIEWQTKTLKKRQGEINRLNEQNKRYRESLEFYANKDNWKVNVSDQWEPIVKAHEDKGLIAFDALLERDSNG